MTGSVLFVATPILKTTLVVVGFLCAAAALVLFLIENVHGAQWWRKGTIATRVASQPNSHDALDDAARAEFSLPGDGIEAARVLGRPRSDVRRVMGTPELSTEDTDVFHGEVVLQVHYLGDRANSLVVGAPQAARHERYVRRWLHLPGDGPLTMNGTALQLALFVGDDDRLGVELPAADLALPLPTVRTAIARAPATVSATQATGNLLLRAFPKLPDNVRSKCRAQGRAGSRGLDCAGFDSGVSYEVDEHEVPQTLTLLDPPVANTLEKCRSVLLSSVPELIATHQLKEPPVTEKEYFASDTVQALVVWAPEHGFRTHPSCSVMACVKGSGRNTCTPH